MTRLVRTVTIGKLSDLSPEALENLFGAESRARYRHEYCTSALESLWREYLSEPPAPNLSVELLGRDSS